MKSFVCSLCKKKFKTKLGTEMHLRDFHKKKSGEVLKNEPRNKNEDDDYESFADRTIEAEINKASGLPYEAWLLGE
jgi:hypothetical protein